ncbi:LysR family transcriptional regulator [Streptomyces sp. NPDC059396]|uniref:LysR family transcriptional regulator n=1 Tax=Streptomyces sp. NPDC059396 TaxID=3346819 RepID=UPI0036B4A799
MDLRHLRYFLAVAETLNFGRAAEQLHIAPSPLSRAIQQLEAEIGGQLFDRDTRRVELTSLGMALVPRAERAIGEVDSLARDMQKRARGRADVNLGFRSIPHDVLGLVRAAASGGETGDVDVQLRPLISQTQIRAVLAGDLDMGLVQPRVEHRSLSYLPVLVETMGMALPADEKYGPLAVASVETLADLTLLLPAGTDIVANPAMERYGSAARNMLAVDFDIVGGFAALVAGGGHCCFAPLDPAAPWHQYVAVPGVLIKPLAPKSAATTSLVWRSSRDNPSDLGHVLHRIREAFPEPVVR